MSPSDVLKKALSGISAELYFGALPGIANEILFQFPNYDFVFKEFILALLNIFLLGFLVFLNKLSSFRQDTSVSLVHISSGVRPERSNSILKEIVLRFLLDFLLKLL